MMWVLTPFIYSFFSRTEKTWTCKQRGKVIQQTKTPFVLGLTWYRIQIDPQKQVSDCHDAVTFLSQHPLVNPSKITLWGLSLSGAVVLAAAALDPRVAAVISLAPTAKLNISLEKQATILQRAIDDRVAQVTKGAPPAYIPMASEEDGSNLGGLPIDPQAIRQLERLSPHFKNHFTVQTSYRLVSWSVLDLLPRIRCPVMVVAPEHDAITRPEVQKAEVFGLVVSEKRFDVVEGRGHWDWWEGNGEIGRAHV